MELIKKQELILKILADNRIILFNRILEKLSLDDIEFTEYANGKFTGLCRYQKRREVINELENCKKNILIHIMRSASHMSLESFEALLNENLKNNCWGNYGGVSYSVIRTAIRKLKHTEIQLIDLANAYILLDDFKDIYL